MWADDWVVKIPVLSLAQSAKRVVHVRTLAPPTFAYTYVGDRELVRDFAGIVRNVLTY